ncbi:MAG TPA: DUF4349 domain-containing protein [Actinomycetota bacterium]
MKTEFDILRLVEEDLDAAAKRDRLLGTGAVRRRGRRFNWGGFAAASVALLIVAGLVGMVARGGLGGSSDDSGSGAATGATGATRGAVGTDDTAPAAQPTPAPGGDQGSGGAGGSEALTATGGTVGPSEDLAKIVRDGSIAIRLPEDGFSDGFAAVTRIAGNNGGFVLTSTTTGERVGTLTLRIPAKRFDQAMLALRELGIVERQRITGKDVTAEFVDLTARLDILKQRRALLLDLQADATTSAEILRLATLVERTQLDIERIQGQLNVLNDQVSESTIQVRLHEGDAVATAQTAADDGPDLGDAWDDAVDGFLSVLAALVVGLGYLIPIAAIGLAIWGVTVWVRRRRAAS